MIDQIFKETSMALKESNTDREYIKNVILLYKALISIHPFLDGNGRTIRLLCDALYLHRKLPVPLSIESMDYFTSSSELMEETIKKMKEFAIQKDLL